MRTSPLARDRHVLYEASVQGVEYDLDLFTRIFRRRRGRAPRVLREDFCGTAAMACAWALRDRRNRALGLDLHRPTLAWARRHHLDRMRPADARRVRLLERDVRSTTRPAADLVVALNFSYWVFHRRAELRDYFRAVRRSVAPDALFVLNAFGGTEAMTRIEERRRIASSQGPDGLRVPGFTYVWEQLGFNAVDHRIRCDIHFRFRDGTVMRRAFRYDWRLWTLPEIRDLLADSGFRSSEVWVEGWDEERNRSDETYRRRTYFENQEGWLAYVIAEP